MTEVKESKRRYPAFIGFFLKLFKEKPLGAIGAVIILLFLFTGIFADVLAPYGVNDIHPVDKFTPPGTQYLLGTDRFGRDMLSRVIYGARISMFVGLGGSALCILIASFIGITTGFLGGKLDMAVQRFVDAWISFPTLFIALAIMSLLNPGLGSVIIVCGLADGIRSSRVVRGAVIGIKENAYVQAAVAIGASTPRILIRHILPNVAAPVIILFTISMGRMIILEATLSFLGFGVPPPLPSWGGMLSGTGRIYMREAPWMALWPGFALATVVYGTNMFGDAIRDLLDPRLRGGGGRYKEGKVKRKR